MVKIWSVEGVHSGKKMSDLPITYLLWFVGSPIMRRTRWVQCQTALREIYRRLANDLERVEGELIADLRPRTAQERLEMRVRKRVYQKNERLN